MGRGLGHSSTGSYFWALGCFWAVRSMSSPRLAPLRRHGFWLLAEQLYYALGGMVYTFGEVLLNIVETPMCTDDLPMDFNCGWLMSTSQHVVMSLTLAICGILFALHALQMLNGPMWGYTPVLVWSVLSILWLQHPQDNEFFSYGHKSIGSMFALVALAKGVDIFIRNHTNPALHRTAVLRQQEEDPGQPTTFRNLPDRIHWSYRNDIAFAHPWGSFAGLMLMTAGALDWQLAIGFMRGDNTDQTLSWMSCQESLIFHVLWNLGLLAIISGVVQLFDNRSGDVKLSDCDEHACVFQDHDAANTFQPLSAREEF